MTVLVYSFGEPGSDQEMGCSYADVISILLDVIPGNGCKHSILESNKCVTAKVWNRKQNKAVFFARLSGTNYYTYFLDNKELDVNKVNDDYVKNKTAFESVSITRDHAVLEKFIVSYFA